MSYHLTTPLQTGPNGLTEQLPTSRPGRCGPARSIRSRSASAWRTRGPSRRAPGWRSFAEAVKAVIPPKTTPFLWNHSFWDHSLGVSTCEISQRLLGWDFSKDQRLESALDMLACSQHAFSIPWKKSVSASHIRPAPSSLFCSSLASSPEAPRNGWWGAAPSPVNWGEPEKHRISLRFSCDPWSSITNLMSNLAEHEKDLAMLQQAKTFQGHWACLVIGDVWTLGVQGVLAFFLTLFTYINPLRTLPTNSE